MKLLKKKVIRPPKDLTHNPTWYDNFTPRYLNLKCGCRYYWVERTNQTILSPLDECPENHRAEIAENVSKEDWENLLKVNAVLGPQSEGIQFMGSSGGFISIPLYYPPHNQGGNTP